MTRKAIAGKEEDREGGLKSDKGERRKKHSGRNLRILSIPKAGVKFPKNDEIVRCLCPFLEIIKTL